MIWAVLELTMLLSQFPEYLGLQVCVFIPRHFPTFKEVQTRHAGADCRSNTWAVEAGGSVVQNCPQPRGGGIHKREAEAGGSL